MRSSHITAAILGYGLVSGAVSAELAAVGSGVLFGLIGKSLIVMVI